MVNHESPWGAFAPIAHLEVMPFRDAGNGRMEHGMSIQVSHTWQGGTRFHGGRQDGTRRNTFGFPPNTGFTEFHHNTSFTKGVKHPRRLRSYQPPCNRVLPCHSRLQVVGVSDGPQDCLYGIHKAIDLKRLDLAAFDAKEYEYYETVE